MWGFGGRFYWGGKLPVSEKVDGIIVVFAWMSSDEKYLKKYVDLYSSIGWDSLVCHSQFLNMFFPEKATSLAIDILNELVEVLKIRPCPIVFASFSGGAKACMFEVLQIIEGKCEAHSTKMQAPYLILCSENDDLAPFQVISNFVQQLKQLGADVKLVKWSDSPHVGHYRHHPIEYQASVTEILGKAVAIYAGRVRLNENERLGIEGIKDGISDAVCQLRKAAATSTSFHGFSLAPVDNLSPSSMEYCEDKDVGSMPVEGKEGLVHLTSRPSIITHGVLGQILFDVCVPENVEGWDMTSNSNNVQSTRRHAPFNPMKCIRRSRL